MSTLVVPDLLEGLGQAHQDLLDAVEHDGWEYAQRFGLWTLRSGVRSGSTGPKRPASLHPQAAAAVRDVAAGAAYAWALSHPARLLR